MRSWLAVALLLAAVTAHAGDTEKARRHYDEGMAFYTVGRYDDAIREFQSGFLAERKPAFLFNIAQAHAAAGRPQEAAIYYRRYLDFAPDATDRVAVEALITSLQSRAATGATGPGVGPRPEPQPAEPPGRTPSAAQPTPPGPTVRNDLASAPAPITSDVAPTPLYKKWWLWTVVGVVVVGGAVTAGAVAATSGHDASVPSTSLGARTIGFQ